MKKTNTGKKVWTAILSAALLMSMAGCGTDSTPTADSKAASESTTADTNTQSSTSEATASGDAKVVNIAFATNGYPVEFMDENNEPFGCDIDTMKKVDEMLDDYTFTYAQGDQNVILSGLQTGTYDIVLCNAFYTDERAEKYILPENPLGAAVVGVVVNNDNPGIETIEDCIDAGLEVAPTIAGDGLWYVLYSYNQEHPEKQVDITVTDSISAFSDTISWVSEGRVGFGIWPKYYWDGMVAAEDGGMHDYASSVYFSECLATKTYCIVNPEEKELADAISECLGKLREDGTLSANALKWYGYDTFEYLEN